MKAQYQLLAIAMFLGSLAEVTAQLPASNMANDSEGIFGQRQQRSGSEPTGPSKTRQPPLLQILVSDETLDQLDLPTGSHAKNTDPTPRQTHQPIVQPPPVGPTMKKANDQKIVPVVHRETADRSGTPEPGPVAVPEPGRLPDSFLDEDDQILPASAPNVAEQIQADEQPTRPDPRAVKPLNPEPTNPEQPSGDGFAALASWWQDAVAYLVGMDRRLLVPSTLLVLTIFHFVALRPARKSGMERSGDKGLEGRAPRPRPRLGFLGGVIPAAIVSFGVLVFALGAWMAIDGIVREATRWVRPGLLAGLGGQIVLMIGIGWVLARNALHAQMVRDWEHESLRGSLQAPFIPTYVPHSVMGDPFSPEIAQLRSQVAFLTRQIEDLTAVTASAAPK